LSSDSKREELYDQLLNGLTDGNPDRPEPFSFKFTEEEVQEYQKICALYEKHVGGHQKVSENYPAQGADLKKRGLYWLRQIGHNSLEMFLHRELLETARSVPELAPLVKLAEYTILRTAGAREEDTA
jgi:hypothetical protein